MQVCLKQHDCQHTFDLIQKNDNEALKKIRNCTYNDDLTTTSYFCDLPKSEKPKIKQPPVVATTQKPVVSNTRDRDSFFVNLRKICGRPGKHFEILIQPIKFISNK